jgi:hypothetical protein
MRSTFSVRLRLLCLAVVAVTFLPASAWAQQTEPLPQYIRKNYTRQDHFIPMRDGIKLYTVVYLPRDATQKYPILMMRTPYGVGPYNKEQYRGSLGPNQHFAREGYLFVYQDVRGCYLSQGAFENMRPHRPVKKSNKDIDESSDTYDTIAWLLKNLPNHNGKVGQWGISYPGFYTSAGMAEAHPALKASSPQAPIGDWFFDDFIHHGAFFLPHAFNFFSSFGQARPEPTTSRPGRFVHTTPDGYQFFLDIGPLKNVNERYFKNKIAFWNEFIKHPTYDAFWQERNILPHLKKTAPAVMTVGGWFDAEDLYGTFKTYQHVEKQNPGIFNVLVVGPWSHGGWSSPNFTRLGNIDFGSNTSAFYQKEIELGFFNHYLKGKGDPKLPEAYVFETGANRWRKFDRWPPKELNRRKMYFHGGSQLVFDKPTVQQGAYDEYVSDPNRPVPYVETITPFMSNAYMTDDQRHASRRTDVLVYQTGPLTEPITLAGPLLADLRVSTSGTDSDWVVKLIDVFPPDAPDPAMLPPGRRMGGYQMLVRSEVIRGRFRNSYSKPEPFVPNQPAKVVLELQDVLHTFGKGHRIMIHVSSSWFPLVDRNPQKYVDNIFLADEQDFIKATQRVHRSPEHPSCVEVGVLRANNVKE